MNARPAPANRRSAKACSCSHGNGRGCIATQHGSGMVAGLKGRDNAAYAGALR